MRPLWDGRGRSGSSDEVTLHFIYSWDANLLSARSVPAGPGDSEVTETGPCLAGDKVECGRLNGQVLKGGEDFDRSVRMGEGGSIN